jgi:UDP-glucose-4-epimerase GalE
VEALRAFAPEAVIHFAASAYVSESVKDPQKYYDNNVAGSLSLLSAMLQARCLNIIFSSSCAVYGDCPDQPIREVAAPMPVNPYGRSKLMVENILADYDCAYGLPSVALRYFNACGADPEGELGELRDPETHLIPRALMAIQGHLADFVLYGNDYDTPDGTPVRDYVHVSDLAEAHVLGLRWLLDGGRRAVFNLGTGRGYTTRQVLDAIAQETGERVPYTVGPRRPGDPPVLVADPSRARTELGFAPVKSDLKTIIQTAWAWHRRAHPLRLGGPQAGHVVVRQR